MFKHIYGKSWDEIIELMKTHRLDFYLFEDDFICNARQGIITGRDPVNGGLVYEEGDPFYPESPNAQVISGNFEDISSVFCFHTDEKDKISQFRKAMAKNKELPSLADELAE